MWMLIRTALVWLLAAALPVQGAAAATMLACGPGLHGAAATHSHSAGEASAESPAAHAHAADVGDPAHTQPHTHPDANAHAAHDHASPHGHDHEAAVDEPAAQGADGNHVHNAAGKCSACASCCTVAVLPTSVLPIGSPPAVDRVTTFFPAQAAVFMTGGPERPPRTILA